MKRFILEDDGNIAEMYVIFILFYHYSLMKKTPHVVTLNRHLKHGFKIIFLPSSGGLRAEGKPLLSFEGKLTTRSIDFEKILSYFQGDTDFFFYKRPKLKG